MSFYEWYSQQEVKAVDSGNVYSVIKSTARKQACLTRHHRNEMRGSYDIVAWFTSDTAAKRFAEDILGGVVYSDTKDVTGDDG